MKVSSTINYLPFALLQFVCSSSEAELPFLDVRQDSSMSFNTGAIESFYLGADRISKTEKEYLSRIAELEQLSTNWDSYDAPSPNVEVVNLARDLASFLARNNVPISRINPSVKGGIAITSSWINDMKISVEICNDEDICTLLKTRDSESISVEFVSQDDLISHAEQKLGLRNELPM